MDNATYEKLLNLGTNLAGILATALSIYIIYATTTTLASLNTQKMIETNPSAYAVYTLLLANTLIYCLWKTAVMLFKLGGKPNGKQL